MALSDHERKMLAQMELALAQDDPKLQSQLEGHSTAKDGKKIIFGFILIIIGFSTLLAGLISKEPVIGIAGFLIALVGVVLFQSLFTLARKGFIAGESFSSNLKNAPMSFLDRLAERWDRRQLGD